MKNISKFFGIIVLWAVIGLSTAGCQESSNNIDRPPASMKSPNAGDLVLIHAGTFQMGDLKDKRIVTLTKAFYMGKYEVTQEQYEAVMGNNPSRFQGERIPPAAGENQGKRPVESVNWYDAIIFCNTLSLKEGLTPAYAASGNNITLVSVADGYRLPTEAEWEYACRAGTTTAFNTGDEFSDDTGWYVQNSGNMTHEVGRKQPNAWGLYDMHGNVYEWCWDGYSEGSTYSDGYDRRRYNEGYYWTNPAGPTNVRSINDRVVYRGGSAANNVEDLRSAARSHGDASRSDTRVGFRIVRPVV